MIELVTATPWITALGGVLFGALISNIGAYVTERLRFNREERHRRLKERRDVYAEFSAQAVLCLEPSIDLATFHELLRLHGRIHLVGSAEAFVAADDVVHEARNLLSKWSPHGESTLPRIGDQEAAVSAVRTFQRIGQDEAEPIRGRWRKEIL
ncbi:hypothetical protein ACFVWN_01235 [Nocardiopsis flavescens]|uniref:hypothetical protein n=1 Tax=Nocardiopsis flavescens TaxID=758803 RepID=UPI003653253E